MTNPQHIVEADGYCPTCHTVPCQDRPQRAEQRRANQLDRIELKLNQLLRLAGHDPDATDVQSEQPPRDRKEAPVANTTETPPNP